MSPSTTKPTKISANLFMPLYNRFHEQLKNALLRRDAFIDKMIESELVHLREDLAGKRLSQEAHRYISRALATFGRKDEQRDTISIAVRKSTADALREAVEEHNLVRDAFLHWLICLLRGSDDLLNGLGLPLRTHNLRGGLEAMPTSPLKAIEEVQLDPLYYLRFACEERYGCGLYALQLPKHLHAFACYLPDEEVPGTEAYEAKRREDLTLLDL